jgi:carbon-monoxide dehydrogenase medium subunit
LDKVTVRDPSTLYALEGELVVKGSDGEQTIPAREFFKEYLFAVFDPQEVVTEVCVPRLEHRFDLQHVRRLGRDTG